ncbi:MAG: hypothetical protein IPP48_13085 [Chitinophagaceae bacterium]|nr:hypothetical protein [Chitinophagaceae bacterium]
MINRFVFLFILNTAVINTGYAQTALPSITVKNIGGKIIVSWINGYKEPVANISIQRSFDSLKNYTTIGSVLNPQNAENGFADNKPPYNKMYYRVFIAFEGGKYLFSNIVRPTKEKTNTNNDSFIYDQFDFPLYKDSAGIKVLINRPKNNVGNTLPNGDNSKIITYPSKRIFTSKNNTVVINLPDAESKKYSVKFFTETEEPVFELNKIVNDYLIVEKVNFEHSGWYNFEVYENGKLIERNKFFVPKDGKNVQIPKEKGNR